jgi:hypothetical protein
MPKSSRALFSRLPKYPNLCPYFIIFKALISKSSCSVFPNPERSECKGPLLWRVHDRSPGHPILEDGKESRVQAEDPGKRTCSYYLRLSQPASPTRGRHDPNKPFRKCIFAWLTEDQQPDTGRFTVKAPFGRHDRWNLPDSPWIPKRMMAWGPAGACQKGQRRIPAMHHPPVVAENMPCAWPQRAHLRWNCAMELRDRPGVSRPSTLCVVLGKMHSMKSGVAW